MSSGFLGFHKSITAGTYNVYQCPVGSYAKVTVNVATDSLGSIGCTLFISPTSTPTDAHTFQKESLNSISNGFIRTAVILNSGEWLSYAATDAGVTVTVDGLEYLTNSKEIAATQTVTTNTEVVLYEAPVDEVITINATITGVHSGTVNSATTKLYVSSSNASGGALIVSNTVGAGKTGFEYSGLMLSSGQKLIMVTTNIVGSLATRVHGFRRDI